jgi:two-component system, NtrC family, sensor kinase
LHAQAGPAPQSFWRTGRISLRTKITAAFTVVVIGGTAVSTLIGSRIITNALLDEARTRNVHGLDAARTLYSEALDTTRQLVRRAAASEPLAAAGPARPPDPGALQQLGQQSGLDFLAFIPLDGDGSTSAACLADSSIRALVSAARGGDEARGTEVLQRSCLLALNPALADRAVTRIVTGSTAGLNSRPATEAGGLRPDQENNPSEITSGLALVAAVPVTRGQTRAGVAYGGLLLNRRSDLPDRVKRLVYGDERYRDEDTGIASIFLGPVMVATNVMAPGEGAVGSLVPAQVPGAVLSTGDRWEGRAFVGHDWFVAACEPIRNYSGAVVGAMFVGMLEAPILAVRTDVMLTFLAVCAAGLGIVFVFTYLITRRTISPLEEMVAATRTIAGGDLTVRVSASSRDEIGDLATSFNEMLSSLQATKRELEEWGRTLEERVQQRTDELVAVQSRMVQSEKLASIGRLAAGVAHSINNPLGGILSLSMLALEEDSQTPALREDLRTIANQALRCREIVKGLLDFSHQSESRVTRTAITPLVDSAIALLERQSVFHSIEVVRRLQPELPPVLIDPGQLQEVITSLVVNAIDAMEDGGTLTIETSAAPQSSEVLIRIADTGKGIPPDVMPFIFEPFFTTKTVGKGTGLGLAIVHGIVTGAGGRIEVATSPKGTAFTIRLPVAPEGDEVGTQASGTGDRQSAAGR